MHLLALALAITAVLAIPSPKHAHLHRSAPDVQGLEQANAVRDVMVTVTETVTVGTDCSAVQAATASASDLLPLPQSYTLPSGWIPPQSQPIKTSAVAAASVQTSVNVPSSTVVSSDSVQVQPSSDAIPTALPTETSPQPTSAASLSSEEASSTCIETETGQPQAPEPTTADSTTAAATTVNKAPATSSDMGQAGSTAALAASTISSASLQTPTAKASTSVKSYASAPSATSGSTGGLPFSNFVIFGDNLSDRGNGSSDHQVAGNPETIYGFKTWTNGLIAAEVLANNLKVPIKYDYAYGHAAGGSKFGATVDNHFTQSDAGAPSCADQIANYTSNGNYYSKDSVSKSMHFVWTGNNDVLPWAMPIPQSTVKVNQSHIFFGSGADAGNQQFATTLATLIANQARSLIAAGAEHIFVPNVYPRHIAPVVAAYFGLDAPSVTQYGQVIQNANTQLKQQLSTLKTKGGRTPIYYDAFGYLVNLYNGAKTSQANGIKYVAMPGKDICDGATGQAVPGTSNWDLCQVQHHADEFFWMQFLDMTAKVHSLLASDMQRAVQAAYA